MNMDEKANVLVATAMSYFERGINLQYDQRCMDRTLFLTPRRRKLLPPEASTSQNTQYLDCSSFVGAVYYEAFGIELPSDLTWHMIDLVEPRVYYHEFTHEDGEHEIVKAQMHEILQKGDVITYQRGSNSGHTLIYIGNNQFVHCTPNGRPDSYDYQNRKSREYEDGGLFVEDIDEQMFNEKRLFSEKISRVSVSRPLSIVGEPTKNAMARIKECDGLYLEVLTNPAGSNNQSYKNEIEYTLKIRETKGKSKKTVVKIETPCVARVSGESQRTVEILPNSTTTVDFKVSVCDKELDVLENIKIYFSEFEVFVPPILLGETLSADCQKKFCEYFENIKLSSFIDVFEIYKNIGIDILDSEKKIIQDLFYLHDSPTGDVLSRKKQNPFLDGAVYSFFGGTGVVTPQMIYEPFIRTNRIIKRDFYVGDIIVISNDACANESFFAVYLGDKIVGKTEYDLDFTVLQGEQLDEFIDSLLGRFCFAVLRPSLKVKE